MPELTEVAGKQSSPIRFRDYDSPNTRTFAFPSGMSYIRTAHYADPSAAPLITLVPAPDAGCIYIYREKRGYILPSLKLHKAQLIDRRNIAVLFRVAKLIFVRLSLVRRWKYREENAMSNEQVAPETKGVTVKIITTVDLGPEIEGMQGRQLRMRLVTIEPGGVFGPIHDHKDRPGTVYILQGSITDHRNGVATDYGPGLGWPEDRNTIHWLENRGTIPAVEISVDIVRQK
jgi:quercetin dioxygenase-like cupin family protein